ncbi:MAG: endo-1,4-beta-xylanase [Leptolyngbyaceae cyanobacterium]
MMKLSCAVSSVWRDKPERVKLWDVAHQFDYWVAFPGHRQELIDQKTQKLQRLGDYCNATGRPLRGHHLFPCYRQESWDWHVARAEKLAAALPQAVAWDVIHEMYQHRKWVDVEDWAAKAFDVASVINPGGRFFISEYRPQDAKRLQWLIDLCHWCLDRGLPLAGISIQLHSHLLSFQPWQLDAVANQLQPLKERGLEFQCFEVVSFLRVGPRRPMPPRAEHIQAKRYRTYRRFAESIGCSVFGPWNIWDGVGTHHQDGQPSLAGLWREDWTEKPVHKVFFPDV